MGQEPGAFPFGDAGSHEMWAWSQAAVARVDSFGAVRWASPAFADLFSATPDSLAGTPLATVFAPKDAHRFATFWSDPVRVRREPFAFLSQRDPGSTAMHVLSAKPAADGSADVLLKVDVRSQGSLAPGVSGAARAAQGAAAVPEAMRAHLSAAAAAERVAGMGSWTYSPEEGFIRWSPGAWALVGIDTDWDQEPPTGDLFDHATADHLPAVLVWWDTVREREGAPVATSFLAVSAAGEMALLRISGSTTVTSDGARVTAGAVRRISESADFDQDLHEMLGAMKTGEALAGMGSWSRELPAGTGVFSDNVYTMMGVPVPPPGTDRTFAIENWVHPDDMEDVIAAIGPSFWEPMPYRFTTRVIVADGSVKFMEAFGETRKMHPDDPQPTRTHGSLRDVTGEVIAQKAIVTLSRVGRVLAEETDASQMITRICEAAVDNGGYAFAAYDAVLPKSDGATRRVAFAGSDRWIAQEHARRVAQVVASGRPLTLPEQTPDGAEIEPAATLLPVMVDGHLGGVLSLWTADKAAFDYRASNTLTNLAQDVGRALTRIQRTDSARQDLLSSMALVTAVLEPRGLTLLTHHLRVAAVSTAIAAHLGLDDMTVQRVQLASLVHDLGKVALPGEALATGSLVYPEEQQLWDRHPEIGRDLAARFPWSFPLPQILLQHHEAFDGSGEPGNLAGDAIRIEARIIRVTDTYVTALDADEGAGGRAFAMASIAAGSGRMFDPQVAAALADVMDEGFAFPKAADDLYALKQAADRTSGTRSV